MSFLHVDLGRPPRVLFGFRLLSGKNPDGRTADQDLVHVVAGVTELRTSRPWKASARGGCHSREQHIAHFASVRTAFRGDSRDRELVDIRQAGSAPSAHDRWRYASALLGDHQFIHHPSAEPADRHVADWAEMVEPSFRTIDPMVPPPDG